MSYHRLPSIRKLSQGLDDEIELLPVQRDKQDVAKTELTEAGSLLSPFSSQARDSRFSTKTNIDHPETLNSLTKGHRTGWRFGVICGSNSATVVLLINLSFTIWVSKNPSTAPCAGYEDSGKLALFHGSCSKAKEINTAAHLIINALSIILLSASNYCM